MLTGRKLFVKGNLKQKIVYSANEPTQSVHGAEFEVPFSAFIVVPADCNKYNISIVEGSIENVCTYLIDKRTISENIVLSVEAKEKENSNKN